MFIMYLPLLMIHCLHEADPIVESNTANYAVATCYVAAANISAHFQ